MTYAVVVRGEIIRSGLTEAEAAQAIEQLPMRADRREARVVAEPEPDTSGPRYQFTMIEPATKNYPKRVQVVAEGSLYEMEVLSGQYARDPAYREVSKGIRPKPKVPIPTVMGYEEYGEPTGVSGTTRSKEEQARVEQKYAEITLKNIAKGTSQASEKTIQRLKEQAGIENVPRELLTPKEFTEAKTLKQLREGTTLTQYKTYEEIGKEREKAQRIAERASEEITAAGIITEYRKLPEEYQTHETLRSIAETSKQRQEAYLPLTVLGQPRQITAEEREPYVAAGRGIEALPQRPYFNQEGRVLSPKPLEVRPTPQILNRDRDFIGGDGTSGLDSGRGIPSSYFISSDKDLQVDKTKDTEKRPLASAIEKYREEGIVISKEDPFSLRFRKTAYNVALISGTAFGNLLQSAKEKPIRTAVGLGSFYGGAKLAELGLIKLGVPAAKAGITVGVTALGGFLGYKEIQERGSVLSPAGVIATGTEVGTYGLGFKGASKLVPKLRTLELPQSKGKTDITALIGFETKGGRAVVLGAKTPEGIRLGTPDILPALTRMPLKPKPDIKVGSALEAATLQKALRQLPKAKEQIAVPTAQTIMRKTAGTQPEIKPLAKKTERLPERGVDILHEIARREGAKITFFGGYSRASQLAQEVAYKGKVFKVEPRLRDVDIRLAKAGTEELASTTKEVLGKFKKVGITVREGKKLPYTIEVKQPSGIFEKAVEFKGKEPILEGEAVPEFVAGIRKEGKPIKTKEGIRITGAPEELRGVLQGVLRVTKKKDEIVVFPSPKRVKDIGSSFVLMRTLEKERFFPSRKLTKAIGTYEDIFPEKLVTSQLKAIEKGKGKLELSVDYAKPSKPEVSPMLAYPIPTKTVPISQISESISPRKSPISSLTYPKSPISQSARPSPSAMSLSGLSASPSKSRSVSQIISSSLSKSFSGSPSVSPSKSTSLSVSPSLSISPSLSVSPSPSKSKSPYPSPSPSPYPSLYHPKTPPLTPILPSTYFPKSEFLEFRKPSKKEKEGKRKFRGTPSLSVVGLGKAAAGTKLTIGQLRGTEQISPFAIRKI